MKEELTIITGKNKGPKSIILAGVHGNETPGIQAFKNLLPKLVIDNGDVTFIYANPNAIEKNVR